MGWDYFGAVRPRGRSHRIVAQEQRQAPEGTETRTRTRGGDAPGRSDLILVSVFILLESRGSRSLSRSRSRSTRSILSRSRSLSARSRSRGKKESLYWLGPAERGRGGPDEVMGVARPDVPGPTLGWGAGGRDMSSARRRPSSSSYCWRILPCCASRS